MLLHVPSHPLITIIVLLSARRWREYEGGLQKSLDISTGLFYPLGFPPFQALFYKYRGVQSNKENVKIRYSILNYL